MYNRLIAPVLTYADLKSYEENGLDASLLYNDIPYRLIQLNGTLLYADVNNAFYKLAQNDQYLLNALRLKVNNEINKRQNNNS